MLMAVRRPAPTHLLGQLIGSLPQPRAANSVRCLRLGRRASGLARPNRVAVPRMASAGKEFERWTRADLVERIQFLEGEIKKHNLDTAPVASSGRTSKASAIDPSKYSNRFIALKLAYLGKRYGGFEFQPCSEFPTIEEELWKALRKSCLIYPKDPNVVDFSCCDYQKCGRTDKGVSAFGQVISLRVRSNQPLPKGPVETISLDPSSDANPGEEDKPAKIFDPINDELPYVSILNRLLPPDIRVLAWCPSPPPDFSARFSCRERRYRYFFTQPAYLPVASQPGPGQCNGWLDIDKMQDAAQRFIGTHDFRNYCKIDPSKQIVNFVRDIFHAGIHEVKDVESAVPYLNHLSLGQADFPISSTGQRLPKVYSFDVHGSAFLWHQIRHMVNVIFLVGQGLEEASVVTELLDVEKYPGRPNYQMADEVPLVLWDCRFPEENDPERKDALEWVYPTQDSPNTYGPSSTANVLWQGWREKKMDELLANQLMNLLGSHEQQREQTPSVANAAASKPSTAARIFEGGNSSRSSGRYVPIAKLKQLIAPEIANDKYAIKHGFPNAELFRAAKKAKYENE